MSDLCKCTMSIRVLGDGCRHCQPQGYIDRLQDQSKDHADRIEAIEAVLRQAKDALECATLHHGLTSLPKKIEHFGSVDAAHDFGRHTWRENIPSAIAAIDEALK